MGRDLDFISRCFREGTDCLSSNSYSGVAAELVDVCGEVGWFLGSEMSGSEMD